MCLLRGTGWTQVCFQYLKVYLQSLFLPLSRQLGQWGWVQPCIFFLSSFRFPFCFPFHVLSRSVRITVLIHIIEWLDAVSGGSFTIWTFYQTLVRFSKQKGWDGRGMWHVWGQQIRTQSNSGGKRPIWRRTCVWDNVIKMDIEEVGWEDVGYIHVAQDRHQWRGVTTR